MKEGRRQRRRASDYDVPHSRGDLPNDQRVMEPKTFHMIHSFQDEDSPPISVLICKKANTCGNSEKKPKLKRDPSSGIRGPNEFAF